MPVVNPLARELVFKIVYYGPGLGGKTTTLQHVYATTKVEHRGKMVSLATPVDRTLYFDFLPIRLPTARGMGVRLQLFTVPGQVYYNATRRLVLTGADGVVFVADSQRARLDANLESLANLNENLREQGRELKNVPHVIAYNKRDLYDIVSIEELERALDKHAAPSFATCATSGDGVYETLDAIARAVLDDFERKNPEARELVQQELEVPEAGLTEALRGIDSMAPASVAGAGSLSPRRPSGLLSLTEPLTPAVVESQQVLARQDAVTRPEAVSTPPGAASLLTELSPSSGLTELSPSSGSADKSMPRLAENASSAPESMPSAPESVASVAESVASVAEDMPAVALDGAHRVLLPVAEGREDQEPSLEERPLTLEGVTFQALWPNQERPQVAELEGYLRVGQFADAVRLADELVSRTLAGVAGALGSTGESPRDPALVVLLLGLDGRRYLDFRSSARDARSKEVGESDALAAFAFAIDARLARARLC